MAQAKEKTSDQSRLDEFVNMPPPATAQAVVPLHSAGGEGAPIAAMRVSMPRDIRKVMDRLKVLAAAGEGWIYRFPVKNRRTGQSNEVSGPSIRMTNAVAREYGNCIVDTRVMDMGDTWLIYAKFTDLETGFTMTRPFQQRKAQGTFGDDARQQDIALQIGVSKAIRNVIANVLGDLCDFCYEENQNSLVRRIGAKLPEWRMKVAERLAEESIDITRAERVVGRALSEWTAPDVAKVVAMAKSVTDGMAVWNDVFPPIDAVEEKTEAAKTAAAPAKMDAFSEMKPGDPMPAGLQNDHAKDEADAIDQEDTAED